MDDGNCQNICIRICAATKERCGLTSPTACTVFAKKRMMTKGRIPVQPLVLPGTPLSRSHCGCPRWILRPCRLRRICPLNRRKVLCGMRKAECGQDAFRCARVRAPPPFLITTLFGQKVRSHFHHFYGFFRPNKVETPPTRSPKGFIK